MWPPSIRRPRRWRPRLGAWVPGARSPALMFAQVLVTVQAGSRGMDYVQPRPPGPAVSQLTVMEAALPLPAWGGMYLAATALVLTGLFGGWPRLMVTGHAALVALSGAFAYGLLAQVPMRSGWVAAVGVPLIAAGLWLGVRRWRRRNHRRFLAAMLLTLSGGWVTAYGLGFEFRTGTALLTAAGLHLILAIDITYQALRRPAPPPRRPTAA